jgi:hypothetical protein
VVDDNEQEEAEAERPEGDFHAHLGWVVHKASGSCHEAVADAERHLREAQRRSPRLHRGYVFLGRIFLATDRAHLATQQFWRAWECNPDGAEALWGLEHLTEPLGPRDVP